MGSEEAVRDPGLTKAVSNNALYFALKGSVAEAFEGSRYQPTPEIDLLVRAIAVGVEGFVTQMAREVFKAVNKDTDQVIIARVKDALLVDLLKKLSEAK